MVRVFFNPIVFRMKRYPQPVALGVATALVFLATWALHAYQKFWLRGAWELTVTDSLFWGVLGGLVLVNVQLDARRARRLPGRAPVEVSTWYAVRSRLVHGLKIAGTFTATILLWSLWGSPSISSWLDLLRRGLGSL